MKIYNKLFAIIIAMLGVTTLQAQEWTDKTSLLVNPSFESETGKTNLTSGWGAPSEGWILTPSSAPSNSQAGVAASSCTISSGGIVTLPTTDEGNFFYVRTNWNNDPTFALSQVISADLPVGLYRLTCKAASNSGNWSTSTFKLTLKESDGNISTNSSLNKCSEWTEWTVDLYKTDPSTSLTIEAAMRAGSSGQGQHYQMLLDDFKLEYMSFDDIEAAGWPKPQIPASNLESFVGTSVVAALYNVEADAFVTRGMTWATQAIATKLHNSDTQEQSATDRHHVKISAGDNGKVRFSVNGKNYLGDGGQGSTTTVYTDNGKETNQFIYTKLNDGKYKLKVGNATSDVDAFLDVAQPYGGQLTYANGQGFTEWAIIKFSDIENGKYASYKAKKAMYEVYKAVVDAGHSATYSDALSTALETYIKPNATASDVTTATNVLINAVSPALTAGYVNAGALFTNPDMRGAGTKADWTSGYTNVSWGVFENYHTNHGDRKLTQTKTVPNGFYKVVFHGIWRQDGGDAAPTLTLTSGSNSISANVPCMTDIAFGVGNAFTEGNNVNNWKDVNGKIIPNGMQSAGEALSHRDAQVTISDFVVSDGSLTIEMNSASTSQWILAQGFDIYYKAESLDEYANLFNAAKSAAVAIDANTLNTYAANQLATALEAAETVQVNKEWYQARTAELNNAVALANSVSPVYVNFKALVASCEAVYENSVEAKAGAKATFEDALTNAKNSIGNLQTADAITTLYNTLEEARKTYIVKADPTNDTYFDFTYMIENPSFETGNTNGWSVSSGGDTGAKLNSNGTYTINGADGEFVYNTWGANPMFVSQTITGLPTGLYTLKAIVASDNGTVVSLTAGTSVNEVTTTDKGTATEGEVSTSCSSGELLIKASSENWFKADHFRLYYYGFDVETAQNGVATLKAEAEALVGKPMNVEIKSALNEAIAGADATKTTRLELQPMIDVLSTAVNDAKASISGYAKLEGYISMTKVFTDVTQYEQKYENGEFAADEVETVRQELNVMRYNAASAVFTNKIEVTGWTGDLANGIRSDQHWSGNTQNYYDANSWTANFVGLKHTLSTTITLPNGTYVLKAAGRSSSDATLRLTIKNGDTEFESVEYTGKGDTGYGIDTSGAANFSEEGEYANNDNGRGWEWEFAKFELDAETTVTLHVEVDYNNIQNRFGSFSDITLWMDDETYVAVNGGAINAPLAAAKALVDTKPMGGAENTALQNAITQAEGTISTPAELDGAIAALETAVANANAWVVEYNNAKAPLVAALERFEADYNDAQNGALNHMNKDRWTTVIEKAQAAAVAKDVTNSYEGFATATENLVAALDAATVSVGEYAELKVAIDAAGTLYDSANWGDAAFQKPIDAKEGINTSKATAQAAYDAAEVDGEGVTAVKESLNNTVNGIVLNAPEEGQRFNIVMSYAGWEHDGKAVTYLAGARNDAGLYNIQYYAAPNVNYAQAFTFTAVAGQPDCYTLSMTDVDNNERYVCTGTVYGGNASQIRTTTDASKALSVKVIATATEGIHQLWNTEANNYIGGQDAGFYTTNNHTTFRLQEAQKAEVTLNITDAGWATLILPFNAEIPEGVTVYGSKEFVEGEFVRLEKAETIVANTPYLIEGAEGTYDFSGYGLADEDVYEDANGMFVGTYVDYKTLGGEYVLQKLDDKVAFYQVGDSKPTVKANRCYLIAEANNAKAFFFFDDEATGINGVDAAGAEIVAIYTVNGAKVNRLQKGLNIVKMSNGKTQKVFVK